jgi:hypothetical protein
MTRDEHPGMNARPLPEERFSQGAGLYLPSAATGKVTTASACGKVTATMLRRWGTGERGGAGVFSSHASLTLAYAPLDAAKHSVDHSRI